MFHLKNVFLKKYNKWSWPKRVMEIAFYIYYGDSGKVLVFRLFIFIRCQPNNLKTKRITLTKTLLSRDPNEVHENIHMNKEVNAVLARVQTIGLGPIDAVGLC